MNTARNTEVWFRNPVYTQLLFLEKLMESELVCLFLYNPNVCYTTIIIHFYLWQGHILIGRMGEHTVSHSYIQYPSRTPSYINSWSWPENMQTFRAWEVLPAEGNTLLA